MTISANQLTLARVVLLPIPLVLLYHGGAACTTAALVTLVALGLTDVFDGPLARRRAPTRLGPVVDGISDRAFVVILYAALCDLRIIPMLALALITARELFVISLRGIAPRTAVIGRAGRLKMTVQMIGAGFLLFMWALPAPWIHVFLGAAVVVSAALLVASIRRRALADWRAAWATCICAAVALARVISLPVAMNVLVAIIVAITLASGAVFAWSVRDEALRNLVRAPRDAWFLALVTFTIPIVWIPLVGVSRPLTFVVAGIGAAQLTVLGLWAARPAVDSAWGRRADVALCLSILLAGMIARYYMR